MRDDSRLRINNAISDLDKKFNSMKERSFCKSSIRIHSNIENCVLSPLLSIMVLDDEVEEIRKETKPHTIEYWK